jgi:ribonuclease P protein component
MIAQKNRFRGHNSVDSVYRRATTFRGSLINLKFVPSRGNELVSKTTERPFRAAVVVSKKVSKSAVVRNRIRRRIYELVREFDTTPLVGSELVFIVYSDQLASLESQRLKAGVHDLLQRAIVSTNTNSKQDR